ncbi:MAG: hypothetical protein QG673_304 [Pseudomonadota bacterium]|nr:hypothetical protein [Pseudomonadota bacterium]
MNKSKKYYWLKLKDDFFENEDIKLIEVLPNGKDYILFYLKLLLKSIKLEGKLIYKNVIPYTEEMLSTITNTNVDTVRHAIKSFISLGLMTRLDDGALFMSEINQMIGSETKEAIRKREYRQKLGHCPTSVPNLLGHCPTEIETDIELDLDIEKEIENKPRMRPRERGGVCEVFEHWQKVMDKPKAKLDSKRSKLISDRLKNYSTADLKLAIDGCSKSEFHMGKNPGGTKYNEISNIFRDNEKLEKFIEMAHGGHQSLQSVIHNCNSQNFASEEF